jgi:hypothetical protein
MADVHGLVQVDELAVLPQAIEKLAEVLLHRCAPNGGGRSLAEVVADPGLSYLDRRRRTIQAAKGRKQ